MSRLTTLKELEAKLEGFLEGASAVHEEKLNRFESVHTLEQIAIDSLRGRFVNNRLGHWLDKNRLPLDDKKFDSEEITQIANFLDDIKKGLDPTDTDSQDLTREIEGLREKGVVPKRKFVLTIRRKPEGGELLQKFKDVLALEKELLESGEFENDHMLSILDDVLKSAEFKTDSMYMHLAGSMIYFLKMNGYKVTPFVKRLKEIEEKRLDGAKNV